VVGHDPDAEPRAFDAFCPIRDVTAAYPPTLLIHGTKDTDVPYEQSELMDRELARQGVEHELITVAGGAHGLGGTDPAVLADIRRRILAFLAAHLGA
jgi:dipeptidyl aminopeptidase/acylaminoacyl peptidase